MELRFLLNIEKQIINRYKYNAIYVKDLVNITFISVLFKNMDFLSKFLGFQFKEKDWNNLTKSLKQNILRWFKGIDVKK